MKTILITGANRGIGLEFVRQYAARDERVLATCRRPADAHELNALAAQHDGQIRVIALDVSDTESAEIANAEIRTLTDTLDILIHNAGVANSGREGVSSRWGKIEMEEMLSVLRTNAVSVLVLTQSLYDLLKPGAIVAGVSSGVGSIEVWKADEKLNFAYSGSKTLMNNFLHHIGTAVGAKDGILSVSLTPGWVRTDMGGANADISVEESVTGMIHVLDNLTPEQSGAFLSYSGETVPW